MPNKTLTLQLTGEEAYINGCLDLFTYGSPETVEFTKLQFAEKKLRTFLESECKIAAKKQAIEQAAAVAEAQTTGALTEITLTLSEQ
jgi:hypothetical protein